MLRRYSDALGIDPADLKKAGVFNAFIEIDSRFHIDPHLLKSAKTPELKESHRRFRNYFEKVLRLLEAIKQPGDVFFRNAVDKLTFPELPYISLGYAGPFGNGSGIGLQLARQLANTAKEIVDAGIKDPVLFELVGLLEDGIGADRISDMTAWIIFPDLLNYSVRVAAELQLKTRILEHEGRTYRVPKDLLTGKQVVLIPSEILLPLPTAYDWHDVDIICQYNARLRNAVNHVIGDTWKSATGSKVTKRDLRHLLINRPVLLKDLIQQYEAKPASSYDFEHDPEGIAIWYEIAQEIAKDNPLLLAKEPEITPEQLQGVVTRICQHFRYLMEHRGLSLKLYDGKYKLRREQFARLLFFGISDVYCQANDLGLNVDHGGGKEAVSFRLSRGYKVRAMVEVKYSSNSHLVRRYTAMSAGYRDGETYAPVTFLVIKTAESRDVLDALERERRKRKSEGRESPPLHVVDGRITALTLASAWEFGIDPNTDFEPIDLPADQKSANLDEFQPNGSSKKSKRGPRYYSAARKREVVEKWKHRDRDVNIMTLAEFLEEEFGTTAGTLNVSRRTFYDWRKKYLPDFE